MAGVVAVVIAGVAAAAGSDSAQQGAAALFSVWAIGVSSSAVGGLIGLLFGIPKLASTDGSAQPSTAVRRYVGNTNLEGISDWLTKAMIGAGLVEARSVADTMWTGAQAYAATAPGAPGAGLVATAGTFGLLWGFFIVYWYARTDMLVAMTSAENPSEALSALGEGAAEVLEAGTDDEDSPPVGEVDSEPVAGSPNRTRGREYWSRRALEAKALRERVASPTRQQLKDIAAIYRLANWMDQAKETYRELIELNAKDPDVLPAEAAFALEQLGHLLQQGGDYEAAANQFDAALRVAPESTQIRYAQARNAALAGDSQRAADLLNALLSQRPSLAARARRDPLLRKHAEARQGAA